jgi:N,N'-diacetyllegionaminate synthase
MANKRTVDSDEYTTGYSIGHDKPVFVIAEAGINHGGNLDLALNMALIAKEVGASAVKYQTFLECELPYKNLTYHETRVLKEYCDSIGILFLSTPHTISAIEALDDLVPMFKLASPFLFRPRFIERVAKKNKPIILSVNENAKAEHIEDLPEARYIFMHTVCKYPADAPQFERLDMFQKRFPDSIWGYSDHTKGINNCKKAVTIYSACLLEKHFKLSNKCVDTDVSVFPDQLEDLCNFVRSV